MVYRSPAITESIYKAQDAAAGTATAETILFRVPSACSLVSFQYVPKGALTGHDTNNAVITIRRRPASGPGTPATIVARTTNVANGNWVAWTAVDFGTLANSTLNAGDIITMQIEKAASGVQIPEGIFVVNLQPRRLGLSE